MKYIKALDILKALPLEPKFKESILDEYPDKLSQAKKIVLDELAWDMYNKYFEIKLQENISLGMEAVKEGTETLGEHFYGRMRKKTEEDMHTWLFETNKDDREIEAVRAKLKTILGSSSASS